MGFLLNLISLGSFLSGTVFGVLICVGVALQFLKKSSVEDGKSTKDKSKHKLGLAAPEIQPSTLDSVMAPEDVANLRRIITFLEDFNAPLKSIGGYLKQIHMKKDEGAKITTELLDRKTKYVIDQPTIGRMEKELHDSLSNLRDHAKVMKSISTFLSDLGKSFSSFSKDLGKLSNVAKNNMYKGLKDLNIDTKEDLIINSWWQALHVSLDYMSSDQDYLSNQVTDELLTFSTQIYDEICVIEKRLNAEGTKQVQSIKEQLSLYESKKRERDKYREKVRLQGNSATLTTQSPAEIAMRRQMKMKVNDDLLTVQTGKLYQQQKEFFNLMPRIDADIQLTVLKSIVETQSQLLKLTECFERQQESNRMISKRMKMQLTNAAASMMQMIREEGNLIHPSAAGSAAAAAGMHVPSVYAGLPSIAEDASSDPTSGTLAAPGEGGGTNAAAPVSAAALSLTSAAAFCAAPEIVAYEEALRAKMLESGIQGFELSLQKVLEGLLQQCQTFDFNYGVPGYGGSAAPASASASAADGDGVGANDAANTGGTSGATTTTAAAGAAGGGGDSKESKGELNMHKESTACLAATNPAILPLLPSRFSQAVGVETCVWFNSFSGRVYRDISNSSYFYNWFCTKLTMMLNKGARPDYIDEFKVNDVKFGVLPPLLMNVQWSPRCSSNSFEPPPTPGPTNGAGGSGAGAGAGAGAGTTPSREYIYDESESEEYDEDDEDDSDEAGRFFGGSGTAAAQGTGNNNNSSSSSGNENNNPREDRRQSFSESEPPPPPLRSRAQSRANRRKYKSAPAAGKPDESEFFTACTADMAFRSGIKFTVTTKYVFYLPSRNVF
jgi:ferritin-like metal-binding protein YciE